MGSMDLAQDRDSNLVFYVFFEAIGIAATPGLLYQTRMIGDGDCGEIDGKKIGRGNRSTLRKPTPAPLLSITKFHIIRRGFESGPPRWKTGN
jgi:hypothetical protein